jgi:AraC-like DNA-binding protein
MTGRSDIPTARSFGLTSEAPTRDNSTVRSAKALIQRDTFSEILQSVRFRSTVLCRSELMAPWGFSVIGRDFASFHIVLRGKCCLEVDSISGRTWLCDGDLVILPHGNAHVVRDSPTSPATRLEDLVADGTTDHRGIVQAGGRGPKTLLVCGGFHFEERASNPLLAALPPMIHLRGRRPGVEAWLRTTLDFLARESDAYRPGADAVIARLADILFIEAIRGYFASPEAEKLGLAVALRDPPIGAALASIHQHPETDWDVEALARQAKMSRTAFAIQFAKLVGEPPLRYVTSYRMNKAAALLRASSATIPQIAERVGYNTEVGFSRAFKRFLGATPAAYRRNVSSTIRTKTWSLDALSDNERPQEELLKR